MKTTVLRHALASCLVVALPLAWGGAAFAQSAELIRECKKRYAADSNQLRYLACVYGSRVLLGSKEAARKEAEKAAEVLAELLAASRWQRLAMPYRWLSSLTGLHYASGSTRLALAQQRLRRRSYRDLVAASQTARTAIAAFRKVWNVAGKRQGWVDLALRRKASQSSMGWGGAAPRAVDGRTDGNYNARSVTHTARQHQPWWQVDLGRSYRIEVLHIWNRTDCCQKRLSDFYVLVSEKPFPPGNLAASLRHPLTRKVRIQGARRVTQVAIRARGRYVRIQLRGRNYLSLAEVQVWGWPGKQLARGRPATQSSTSYGGVAARAVDGNTNGRHSAGSMSHTGNELRAWWQVDLGSSRWVDRIRIWNRTDCCYRRLSNFYVMVSEQPFSSDAQTALRQEGFKRLVLQPPFYFGEISVKARGRYVRLQLVGQNYLSLAEVEVLGE